MPSKFSKVKMPEKPAKEMEAAEELEMDFPMEDEMAADAEAELDADEMEMPAEEGEMASDMDAISDDELLAELKRRGLSAENKEAEAEEEVEDEAEAEEIG